MTKYRFLQYAFYAAWWLLGLGITIAGGWMLDRVLGDGWTKTVLEWILIGVIVSIFVGVPKITIRRKKREP